ncbi:MAG: 50S ribosomal protein L15 [Minisyncoccia bacterium]
MKYHELKSPANKSSKRIGRGISAGQGKTAGRGTKGQRARTGSSRKPGFEGGQNPLMQRLPKLRGFKSHKVPHEIVYTGQINRLGGVIDNHKLVEAGLVSSPYTKVKLLDNGAVDKKLNVKLQSASAGAVNALKKNGGDFVVVGQIGRIAKKLKQK